MDLTRIRNFINDNANENTELLADLATLETQNTEYDTNYSIYKNGVDKLTNQLTQSRAENVRLLGLIEAEKLNGERANGGAPPSYKYSTDIYLSEK